MAGVNSLSGPSAAPKAKPTKASKATSKKAPAAAKDRVYDLRTQAGKIACLTDEIRVMKILLKTKYAIYEKRENYPKFLAHVNARIKELSDQIKAVQEDKDNSIEMTVNGVPAENIDGVIYNAKAFVSMMASTVELLTFDEQIKEAFPNR